MGSWSVVVQCNKVYSDDSTVYLVSLRVVDVRVCNDWLFAVVGAVMLGVPVVCFLFLGVLWVLELWGNRQRGVSQWTTERVNTPRWSSPGNPKLSEDVTICSRTMFSRTASESHNKTGYTAFMIADSGPVCTQRMFEHPKSRTALYTLGSYMLICPNKGLSLRQYSKTAMIVTKLNWQ